LAIGKLLKDQLEKARAEYLAAKTRLDLLLNDSAIDVPHADVELRIQHSRLESRAALRNYSLALKRFANFTDSGFVPED
jgi:hypothetical protein